jgi:hypothetical protein
MSMGRRFVRMWLIIVVCCLVCIAVAVLPFLLNRDDVPAVIVTNSVFSLIGVGIVLLVGGVVMYRNWSPTVIKQAHASGIPSSAIVTEVTPTGWRMRVKTPESSGWRVQQGGLTKRSAFHKHEYKLRVQVTRAVIPTHEAVIFQMLTSEQVPRLGDTIAVKVHPQHDEIVVMTDALTVNSD